MMNPANGIPPVADNELLARYIVSGKEKREDGTVRPQLFVPYTHVNASVQRWRESNEEEIWTVGRDVATVRQKTLYGLVNIYAGVCRGVSPLDVTPERLENNPNHANIVNYPPDKPDQLSLAQKLAAEVHGNWIPTP